MQFLRYYLLIAGLFEIWSLYKLYLTQSVAKLMDNGFFAKEQSSESVLFLFGFLIFILMMTRFHLVLDMTNKNLYRLALWLHLGEALVLVWLPWRQGTLNLYHQITLAIICTPLWMIFSYRYYLLELKMSVKTSFDVKKKE